MKSSSVEASVNQIIAVRLWAIVLAWGLLWPNISGATVTIFTDRLSWNLAAPSATTINFETPAAAPYIFVPSPPGFSASGVNFSRVSGSTGFLFLLNGSYFGTPSQVLSSQESTTGLDGFSIVFPVAVTAIALDFDTLRCVGTSCLPGEAVTFTLSSGDTFPRTSISAPRVGFVGLTSTTAFTSLTMTISGTPGVMNGVLNIDNFAFGSSVVAPATPPSISSVSPNPVTGSSSAQPFTVNGSNFVTGANVTLRDLRTGNAFPNRQSSSFSSTRIVLNPIFTTAAANWTVEVINPDGQSSGQFQFSVVAPPANAQSDLVIQNLTVNPTSGAAGSNATVSFTIRNQGGGTASASTTNVRINSSSINVVASDPLLITLSTPSIAAGGTQDVSQPVTIPANRPVGTNFIWVILDVNSTANQSIETNDRAAAGFNVLAPVLSSDLIVQNLTVNPTSGLPSSNTTVSFTIRNQGGGTANASTTNIRIATSASNVTTNDPLLISLSIPNIRAGATRSVKQSITIPRDRAAGNNFIWVILDVNSTANQSNENNDRANHGFAILQPGRADFVYVATGDSVPSGQDIDGLAENKKKAYPQFFLNTLGANLGRYPQECVQALGRGKFNIAHPGHNTTDYLNEQLDDILACNPDLVTATIGADNLLVPTAECLTTPIKRYVSVLKGGRLNPIPIQQRIGTYLLLVYADASGCLIGTFNQIDIYISTLETGLPNIVDSLIRRSNANLLLTNYYNPLAGTDSAGWIRDFIGSAFEDFTGAVNSLISLNAATHGSRVALVDIHSAFVGHEVGTECTYIAPLGLFKSVNKVITGLHGTPIPLGVHPNEKGQRVIESLLVATARRHGFIPPDVPSTPFVACLTSKSGVAGSEVTIQGAGFEPGLSVTIGGQQAEVINVSADGTAIRALIPTSSSFDHFPNAVTVTNSDGASTKLEGAFTYTQ